MAVAGGRMFDLKSVALLFFGSIALSFIMTIYFRSVRINPKNKPFLGISFAVLVVGLGAVESDVGEAEFNVLMPALGAFISYAYLYIWGWRGLGETDWSARQKNSKVPYPERDRRNWQYRREVKRLLWWGPCCRYFYYCSSRSVGFNEQFVWYLDVCCSKNIPTKEACRAVEDCLFQGRDDIEKCREALQKARGRL